MDIKPDYSLILAIYIALLAFGLGYNALVARLERSGLLEGFTWLAVVVGTSVVLGALALIDLRFAMIATGAFIAAGTPMAGGAIVRYITTRKAVQDALRRIE